MEAVSIVELIKALGTAGVPGLLLLATIWVARQWLRERDENRAYEREMQASVLKTIAEVNVALREMVALSKEGQEQRVVIISNQTDIQTQIRALTRAISTKRNQRTGQLGNQRTVQLE